MKKLLLFILPAIFLTSCKEEDDTVPEYVNWQEVNEKAFKTLYNNAIQSPSDDLDTIRTYTKLSAQTLIPEDYIVVRKLQRVQELIKPTTKTGIPIYSDSVKVSYRGKLQPSTSFPTGKVFDKSFSTAEYSPVTSRPASFSVSGVITGFSTALQNMHIGDHWIVYIPHQLGYGTTEDSTIPQYSLLTFEIILENYW
ncbi:MAG: FKBP-type peptidyl-prolyl cis-trans isomerase [Bacteroidaceae bacterium]|nr:FKBP-type peptidyl-prolyl cis-trans isomerase [Bacteroidaceae bacterium]